MVDCEICGNEAVRACANCGKFICEFHTKARRFCSYSCESEYNEKYGLE